MDNIIEKELSYSIVKAAYEVFNELGSGFNEDIYEEAMVIVLKNYQHLLEQQKRVDIFFRGIFIGFHKLALVINFGAGRLQVARVVNSKRRKINSTQTNF